MNPNIHIAPTVTLDEVIQYAKTLNMDFGKHQTREAALAELIKWYSQDKFNAPERLAPIEHLFVDFAVFVKAIIVMAELLENTNQTN